MPNTLSPLRYPGGKSRFYEYVRLLLDYNNLLGETYIEPFAGGAGLAIKLLLNNDVSRIVINDYDQAIYAFWYSVINNCDIFCDMVYNVNITYEEWQKQKNIYCNHDTSNLLLLGFATFFLNRTNISGVINGGVIGGIRQSGKYKMDARFNKQSLIKKIQTISNRKDQIILLNEDAKQLLNPINLRRFYKALIYLDPPYVAKGSQLYKNAFKDKDHIELCNLISNCKRKWVVTYDICQLIDKLYHKFRSSYLNITYNIMTSKKANEYIFFSDNLELPSNIKLRK